MVNVRFWINCIYEYESNINNSTLKIKYMNWGKGITIVMIGFMSFILYMVITMMSKHTDLQSEDYYQKEIEYEKEIKALSNTNLLAEKVKISENGEYVIVQFPALNELNSIEVSLFRPNDQKDDQTFTVSDSKTLMIPLKKLKKGVYKMNIQYKVKGELYMQKENLKV